MNNKYDYYYYYYFIKIDKDLMYRSFVQRGVAVGWHLVQDCLHHVICPPRPQTSNQQRTVQNERHCKESVEMCNAPANGLPEPMVTTTAT